MNEETIKDIRECMKSAATYPHEWTKRVSIKQMTEYLKEVHPELEVQLDSTTCYKDTKMGRLRSPGMREYTGYKLRVWKSEDDRRRNWRFGTLIDHDSTDTYRRNYEVAKKIIKYEEEKEIPDECPECRERLEGNFDDTGLICPECSYEYIFKTEEDK